MAKGVDYAIKLPEQNEVNVQLMMTMYHFYKRGYQRVALEPVYQQMIARLALTDEQKESMTKDGAEPRIQAKIRSGRSELVKKKYLMPAQTDGKWQLTDEGLAIMKRMHLFADPDEEKGRD